MQAARPDVLVESGGRLGTERARAGAPALAEHVRDIQVEVDVVDGEPGHLGQAHSRVDEEANDREVASVVERRSLARAEDLRDVGVGEHRHRHVGHVRRLHPCHGSDGDLAVPLVAPRQDLNLRPAD
jgi:hypothetical protein